MTTIFELPVIVTLYRSRETNHRGNRGPRLERTRRRHRRKLELLIGPCGTLLQSRNSLRGAETVTSPRPHRSFHRRDDRRRSPDAISAERQSVPSDAAFLHAVS